MLKKGDEWHTMEERRGRRTKGHEKLARERIERLFNLAEEISDSGDDNEPKRLIELARLIGRRYNQRFNKSQRTKICRGCNSFLNSNNSRNRLSSNGWKTVTCLNCDSIRRYRIPKKSNSE